jgi:hypothetical protein
MVSCLGQSALAVLRPISHACPSHTLSKAYRYHQTSWFFCSYPAHPFSCHVFSPSYKCLLQQTLSIDTLTDARGVWLPKAKSERRCKGPTQKPQGSADFALRYRYLREIGPRYLRRVASIRPWGSSVGRKTSAGLSMPRGARLTRLKCLLGRHKWISRTFSKLFRTASPMA